MAEKKNRIALALGIPSDKGRAPLAKELGEMDENPAEEDGAVDEAAKKEAGDRLLAAIESKDGVAVYDAVCGIYELDEGGGGGGEEDEEEPYSG